MNSTRTVSGPTRREPPPVPATMRAAALDHFGGPEVITLHTLPVPKPDDKEVLIKLTSAGVGSWDAAIRAGWSPGGKMSFPYILGTDGAGAVAAVGRGVRRFHPGDRVYSYRFLNPKGGFYAEYVAVPADAVSRIPANLDLKHAGAIGTTGLTALQGIDDALEIKKGEAVIIVGASGGVGSLALQFARIRGARVLAVVSGNAGISIARKLGADATVDGKLGDVGAAIARFAPDGIDAVLGLAGGGALERSLDALKPHGRFAYPHGIEPEPAKRRRLRTIPYDAVAGPREFERLNRAAVAANLQVPIAATFPLSAASKAHERLAEGHIAGKIILTLE